MSYIITAKVHTGSEENLGGNIGAVNANILKKDGKEITFDVCGDFSRQKEITLELCKTLIDAGFVSFEIGHSY